MGLTAIAALTGGPRSALSPSPVLPWVPEMATAQTFPRLRHRNLQPDGAPEGQRLADPMEHVWGQGLAHSTWTRTLLRQESKERNPSAAEMLWRQQLLLGFRCPLSSRGGVCVGGPLPWGQNRTPSFSVPGGGPRSRR